MSKGHNKATPSSSAGKTSKEGSNIRSADEEYFFGMKAKGVYPQADVSDDYEQRFPEDPMFEETGPNARVWRTYLVESMSFDENMVGEAKDGLDAMLVFAGLFSAVVTSFLVQASENLQVDYTEISASLLSELITVQRAAAAGASVSAVPAAALNMNMNFIPNTLDVWVNGLWVVSLTLSLVVALFAVLIKQWLHRYIALRSGTPKDRSHIRHSRFIGFEKWQVLGIVGSLPIMMHLSLWLFLLGLVLFLIPLQLVLACIIGAMTLVFYTLYLSSNIIPIFYTYCPYQTPLSDFLGIIMQRVRPFLGIKSPKTVAPDDTTSSLSVQALYWLFNVSTNPSVHSVVLQAFGGLPATAAQEADQVFSRSDIQCVHDRLLSSLCVEWKSQLDSTIERLLRASVVVKSCRSFYLRHDIRPEVYFRGDDPRFRATLLSSDDKRNSDLMKSFIFSHHDVLLHPLVWQTVVERAMAAGTFKDYQTDHTMFEILCPAVFGEIQGSTNLLQTMAQAIRCRLHKELCEHLLAQFRSLETVPVGVPPLKLMLSGHNSAAGKLLVETVTFALHRISANPTDFDGVHWQYIHAIVIAEQQCPSQPDFDSVFCELAVFLIQQTDLLCTPQPQGPESIFRLRAAVLDLYRWSQTVCKDSTKSQFPALRRAIAQSLADISCMPASMLKHLDVALIILAEALQARTPSAYELLVEYNCLELDRKHYDCSDVLVQFVEALASDMDIFDAATRDTYIDYLFQSTNLRMALLSSIEQVTGYKLSDRESVSARVQAWVHKIVRLRPSKSAWEDCRQWLPHLLKWVEKGKRKKDLQNNEQLWEGWMFQIIMERHKKHPELYDVVEEFIRALDRVFAEGEMAIITAAPESGSISITVNDTDNKADISRRNSDGDIKKPRSWWTFPQTPMMRMLHWRQNERERNADSGAMELQSV